MTTTANDPLSGIRLKRARAWDQINGLKSDLQAFLDDQPYAPRVNFNTNIGILTVSVHVQKTPDPMWGVRVGEIIHNLRSALDHAVWELVILTTKSPPPKRNKNQFPVFETKAGFEDRGVNQFLHGVRGDAIDLIRSEQPFPQTDGGTGEGIKSPLWHLHELSNHDKHRTLHLTGTMLTSFHAKTAPLKFTVRTDILEQRDTGPIQEDAVLRRVLFRHHRTGAPVTEWPFVTDQIEGNLAVDVAFHEGTPTVGGWLVFGTLVEVANRTDRILRRIAEDIFRLNL